MFSNIKSWHWLSLLALLCLIFVLYLSRSSTSTRQDSGADVKQMTAFLGGPFEASGVAAVAGTPGVLFVDNGRKGQVLWMSLDQNGKQAGAIKPLELGVSIEDLEGLTTDGTYFYVVSSQSRPKGIASAGLVRFKFDARTQTIQEVASISGLKKFLVENVAELRGESERKGSDGGINIEGLAWDPRQGKLLLGLRSPIIDGHALLVPLSLRDSRGAFSIENLEVAGAKAIRLPLGGMGIRGIEYDAQANVFRIINGAADNQSLADFGLWQWNGNEQRPEVRETTKFDKRLKPEGVARVTAGSRNFLIIVFDAGGYTIID